MMNSNFDAVIVGAGPSGWSAALSLREAGRKVLVVEQSAFPRDKVCGGFLGAENEVVLRQWGVWQELIRRGAREIRSIRLAASNGANVLWSKPDTDPGLVGLGVSRRVMDQSFQNMALACGIVFQDATCVEKRQRRNQIWELQLLNRSRQTKSHVTARHLILAAGVPRIERPDPKDLIGAYALFENASLDSREVGLYFAAGGHAGVNPFESGLTNVCYVVSRELFDRKNRSLPQLFEYFKSANPLFSKVFRSAKAVTPWKAVAVPFRPDFRFHEDGIFYAGDAAAVIHPIVGGGMTLAIDGGSLLGNLLGQGRDMADEDICAAYKKTFMKLFALRLQSSWWIGRVSHNRTAANLVVSAGAACRRFLQTAYQFHHHSSTHSTGSASWI